MLRNAMLRNAPLSLAVILTLLVVGLIIERNVLPGTNREHREQAAQYGVENNLATPPRPFHFDGCTLFPDRIGANSSLEACLTHDIAYWYDGSNSQRRHADQVFRHDIRESGSFGRSL